MGLGMWSESYLKRPLNKGTSSVGRGGEEGAAGVLWETLWGIVFSKQDLARVA